MSVTQAIQNRVYNFACSGKFNAPYGVLVGQPTNKQGRKYRSVTFGYARTRDLEVCIYGDKFIVVRDSRAGNTVYRSETDLFNYLNTL